jgi:DNA-directed RNA polymerase I, II, and III subunit RPABC2
MSNLVFKYNDINQYVPGHQLVKVVKPEDRITSEYMTLYEYTEVVSIRASQIQNDPDQVYTNVSGLTDPVEMAKKEIADKKCPLSIRRFINANEVEIWQVNEMVPK